MNEQLQNALAELIFKATSGMEQATQFVVGELPDVVQQALEWYFISNLIYFVIGCTLTVVAILCTIKLVKTLRKKGNKLTQVDSYGDTVLSTTGHITIVCYGGCMFLFVMTLPLYFNLEWLQIWIAPKLWLIEYATHLVK